MHIYSCTPLMHHFHVPSSFLFLELFFPRNLRWVSACSVSSSGSHHCWSRGGNKEWFVQTPEHSFKHTFARVYRWSSSLRLFDGRAGAHVPSPSCRFSKLPRQFQILWAKRREINGKILPWLSEGDQGLAFTAGQGKVIDFACRGQSFATSDHPHDVDYFPRALQGTSKGHAMPPLDDLWTTAPQSKHEAVLRESRHGHGRHGDHRRRTGSDLHDARSQVDATGFRSEICQRCDGIVASQFRRPGPPLPARR